MILKTIGMLKIVEFKNSLVNKILKMNVCELKNKANACNNGLKLDKNIKSSKFNNKYIN